MPHYLTNLAGLTFRPAVAKDVVKMLRPGHQIELEREPMNAYDENAIKVFALVREGTTEPIPVGASIEEHGLAERCFIGYVEKLANPLIARDLDQGLTFVAHVEKSYDDYDEPVRTSMWGKPLIAIDTLPR